MSAKVSICHHMSVFLLPLQLHSAHSELLRQDTSAYVRIRQNTSAYVIKRSSSHSHFTLRPVFRWRLVTLITHKYNSVWVCVCVCVCVFRWGDLSPWCQGIFFLVGVNFFWGEKWKKTDPERFILEDRLCSKISVNFFSKTYQIISFSDFNRLHFPWRTCSHGMNGFC